MLWISVLALFMAGALVKLGVAMVMVSILSAALWVAGAGIAVLLSFVMWQSWRR